MSENWRIVLRGSCDILNVSMEKDSTDRYMARVHEIPGTCSGSGTKPEEAVTDLAIDLFYRQMYVREIIAPGEITIDEEKEEYVSAGQKMENADVIRLLRAMKKNASIVANETIVSDDVIGYHVAVGAELMLGTLIKLIGTGFHSDMPHGEK